MLFNPFIEKKKFSNIFFFARNEWKLGKKMNEFLPLKDARRWMAVEERRGGRSVNEVSSLLVMDWGLLSLLLFLSSILVCHDWAIKQLDPISNGKRQQFCSFFISSPLSGAQVSPAGGTCRSNWNPKTTPRVGIWGRQCLVHLRPTSWQMTDLLSILLLLWTRVSRDVIKHQLDPKRNKKKWAGHGQIYDLERWEVCCAINVSDISVDVSISDIHHLLCCQNRLKLFLVKNDASSFSCL